MNALLRIAAWVLAVALVALPVVAVLNGWVGADRWPLTKLQATGEFRRVDGTLLRQTLMPYAQRGFFAVDLDAAQDAVAQLPWVETAEVRKRWPDTLEVRVVEHKPFARWGEDRLLSERMGGLRHSAECHCTRPLPDGRCFLPLAAHARAGERVARAHPHGAVR